MWAAEDGHTDIVRRLLDGKANCNMQSEAKWGEILMCFCLIVLFVSMLRSVYVRVPYGTVCVTGREFFLFILFLLLLFKFGAILKIFCY